MEKHKRISATRMLKNANHLLGQAPQLVDPELAQKAGIEILKPAQLRVVHDPSRVKSAGLSERQLKALSSVKFETRSLKFDTGLFSGTVHVVDLSFRITGQNNQIIPLPANTIPIVIEYLTLAVNSVSQYTSQYGSHSVTISQIPLVAQVDVPTTSYNNGWLKNWVNTIAADANIPPTDCICILNPLSMVNSSAPNAEYGGFHSKAHCPYIFVNLNGTTFTVDDPDLVYADSLSHELAETIVDPQANLHNPEVCDPCAGNCNNLFLNCFTRAGEYLGTVQGANFDFAYDYFISAVVQPAFTHKCPAPEVSCAYWPLIWSGLGGPTLQQIAAANESNGSLDVFGLGKDGAVYLITNTAGAWSGWSSLLGTQLKQISVAPNADGRLQVFAAGGDGKLYSVWQTPPDNAWGQWENFAGENIRQVAALPDGNRILVVFALDKTGAISTISQTGVNGLWGNWTPLQGHALKQITAAVNSLGQLVVFALGGDGEVYFRLRDNAGMWAAPWTPIPGAKFSQIAVSQNGAGLVLFGTGADKAAWVNAQAANGGAWGAWSSLQGSQLKGVAAANDGGSLNLFALGGDNRAYLIAQTPPPNSAWGSWSGVGASELLDFQELTPIMDANLDLELFGLSSAGTVFQIFPHSQDGHA